MKLGPLHLFLILFCLKYARSNDSQFTKHKPKPKPTPYQDWDYIVFTQRWPITGCTTWEEKGKNNTCALPSVSNEWIVHGLWPTKKGTHGPLFCNSSIHFDPTYIAPIEADLEKYWTNIEGNSDKYSLWKHEWTKHGTCATQHPLLNSVLNYFSKGLEWIKQYNMASILEQSKIVPSDDGYTLSNINDAVVKVLKVTPAIECDVDKAKNSLINEIRICFNKDFELIDCTHNDGLGDGIATNCNLKKPIMYLSKIPANSSFDSYDVYFTFNEESPDYDYDPLFNFYKLVKFMIWVTL